LPSRGEISRRFGIHANTVSNAYQKLNEQGLIEFKPGSGFFVCELKTLNNECENELDSLMANFINTAQNLGFSVEDIENSLTKHLNAEMPKHILIIESDEELRKILVEEIKTFTNFEVSGISFKDFEKKVGKLKYIFAALGDEQQKIRNILPADKFCIYLKSNSVPEEIQGKTRPSVDSMIAIVSGWEKFLLMAKTILVAAEIDSDSIIIRSVYEINWQRGLENTSMIICDLLTAGQFDDSEKVRPFRFIADSSIEELSQINREN
jgi:DNA-binding transcriptional regulator YhcF (GntR family)